MGLRFRKSIKLGKNTKLNIGKGSVGLSVGGRRGGVSINSRSGARVRASVPGTGISYSTKLSGGKKQNSKTPASAKTPKPRKPPKSPKVYFTCGILMLLPGILMLFLFWPLGLFFLGFGVYYIACGPRIYSDLVEKYKAVYPEFEEDA